VVTARCGGRIGDGAAGAKRRQNAASTLHAPRVALVAQWRVMRRGREIVQAALKSGARSGRQAVATWRLRGAAPSTFCGDAHASARRARRRKRRHRASSRRRGVLVVKRRAQIRCSSRRRRQ